MNNSSQDSRQPSNRTLVTLLTIAALSAIVWFAGNYRRLVPAAGSDTEVDGPVTVKRLAPGIAEHYLDGGDWQLKRQLGSAFTHWSYICKSDFKFDASDRGHGQFVLHPTSAQVELSLPITLWLPFGVDQKLHQHELGHCEICKRVYTHASHLVARDCKRLMAKDITIEAKNAAEAMDQASHDLHVRLALQYQKETDAVAHTISDRYDLITNHGMNKVSSEDGIEQAMKSAKL